MILSNQTSIPVQYTLMDDESSVIPPKGSITIVCDAPHISIKFSHLYNCHTANQFDMDKLFHIVINSFITLSELNDESAIIINGEKVHFELGYVYDRFFIRADNCIIANEALFVSDLNALQRSATVTKTKDSFAERSIDYLLSGGIIASTALFIVFKLAFWANDLHFPWSAVILFWAAGLGIQIIGEQSYYSYLIKKQPKLQELYQYAAIAYITEYYNNQNRKWIGNDIQSL